MDLVTALLSYRFPVEFSKFSLYVPAYCESGKSGDAILRMFERDKDELRALGFPIEVHPPADGAGQARYRLRADAIFLPYLGIVGQPLEKRETGDPYKALTSLAFTPDQLELLVRASRRAQQLGDPILADEAARAIRKFAFDVRIPSDAVHEMLVPDAHDARQTVDALDGAVQGRKRATFNYRSMEHNTVSARDVEPLGLIFMSSSWYLIANDRRARGVRMFKVRRITDVEVNTGKPQSPDFEVPDGFDLAAYLHPRRAWELGDGNFLTAVVEFTGTRGAIAEAKALGEPDGRRANRRKFKVRRIDTFARWLLSFGGDAQPISPSSVRSAWKTMASDTAALYRRPS